MTTALDIREVLQATIRGRMKFRAWRSAPGRQTIRPCLRVASRSRESHVTDNVSGSVPTRLPRV